jgi:hypothetical protein
MATLQQQIRDAFFAKLTESGSVDAQKLDKLRALMADGRKLKADDVVKLFSSPGGDGLGIL